MSEENVSEKNSNIGDLEGFCDDRQKKNVNFRDLWWDQILARIFNEPRNIKCYRYYMKI